MEPQDASSLGKYMERLYKQMDAFMLNEFNAGEEQHRKEDPSVPKHVHRLQEAKNAIQEAKALEGQRRKTNSDNLVDLFMSVLGLRSLHILDTVIEKQLEIPPAYPPSIAPLKDLKKIMIDDLLLETHHRGAYLLLHTCTPPDRLVAIKAVVQDENRATIMMQLYYQEEEATRAADLILPKGTSLVIKEPYLKAMKDGTGDIRVDHPSDVLIFSDLFCKLKASKASAAQWESKADELLEAGQFHEASTLYSGAIACSRASDLKRHTTSSHSRALCNIGRFEEALEKLDMAPISMECDGCRYYRGIALYNLGRYRECSDIFAKLCQGLPDNTDLKHRMAQGIKRLIEKEKGTYNFEQLYREAKELKPPCLDHATYLGPVAVRKSGLHGRGLFTTQAVRSGDLLICEKAHGYVYLDKEDKSTGSPTVLINAEKNMISIGGGVDLIGKIVQKLSANPSMSKAVTELYSGNYSTVGVTKVDGKPVVDTFLIERIMSFNVFSCPLTSWESRKRLMLEGPGASPHTVTGDIHKDHRSCGIWPTVSYINHSCNSNTARSWIGDMMIVRASRDLPADTELTFEYYTPDGLDYEERQKKNQNWGFKCSCTICLDELATEKSTLLKRKSLMDDIVKQSLSSSAIGTVQIGKMQSQLATMATTYRQPPSKVPRQNLWRGQLVLIQAYFFKRQYHQLIGLILESFTSMGYTIEGGSLPRKSGQPMVIQEWGLLQGTLVESWVLLAKAYEKLAPDLMAKAKAYAKLTYRICVGEDVTFEETYGWLM